MPKKNKRKFKPINSRRNKMDRKETQAGSTDNSKWDMQTSNKPKLQAIPKLKLFGGHVLSFAFTFFLSLVGEYMLLDIKPTLGFVLPIVVVSMWIVWEVGRLHTRWYLRLIMGGLLVFAVWASMPLYIDRLPELGRSTIEFKQPYFDSTNVTVHYGMRENDFFFTDKVIGELKQKDSVVLNVNGEDILRIHTDGRQVFVDARLFSGYIKSPEEEGYLPIGTSQNFSVTTSGYTNTDGKPNKFYARKSEAFELRVDPVVDGMVTASILGGPIVTHKYFAKPVTISNSALDRQVTGWNIRPSQIGFEVTNEHNIPVMVVRYKDPYQITVSGLFLTSLGILKIDNNDNVIFEFGDSPLQLGDYRINRMKPHTISDLFNKERIYNLHEIYRVR